MVCYGGYSYTRLTINNSKSQQHALSARCSLTVALSLLLLLLLLLTRSAACAGTDLLWEQVGLG